MPVPEAVVPPQPVEVIEQPVVPPPPPHLLHTFFSALARARAGDGQVNVLHLGASHTASDTFTGPVRELLQTRFGDAGRGLSHPGSPWRWFRQQNATYSQTGDWTAWRGIRRHAVGPFGVGGLRLQSDAAGDTLTRGTCERCTLGAEIDEAVFHVVRAPGGGSVELWVDEVLVDTVSTALTPDEVARLRAERVPVDQPELPKDLPTPPDVGQITPLVLALERGPHTVALRVVGDGPVSVTGVRTSLDQPGLRYHSLGINGTRADQFLAMPERGVVDEVAMLAPDLIVLHWGINEMYADSLRPSDPATASPQDYLDAAAPHADTYVDMVTRLRLAKPDASCLFLLPSDLTPAKHPAFPAGQKGCVSEVANPLYDGLTMCVHAVPPTHAAIRAAQVAAAERAGCAVWDQQAAMGGPGSMNQWANVAPRLAGSDGIHLTMAGYRLLAERFTADLLDAFDAWSDTPGPLPAVVTTPVDVVGWVAEHPDDRPEPD